MFPANLTTLSCTAIVPLEDGADVSLEDAAERALSTYRLRFAEASDVVSAQRDIRRATNPVLHPLQWLKAAYRVYKGKQDCADAVGEIFSLGEDGYLSANVLTPRGRSYDQ